MRFHEPAKWVARLRARNTDPNPILFLTNMATGHSGFSGRFGFVHEQAQITAWLLSMVGGIEELFAIPPLPPPSYSNEFCVDLFDHGTIRVNKYVEQTVVADS